MTTPTDGCLASAQDQLYGDFRRWFQAVTIVNNLATVIQPAVWGDPRYQQRLVPWSECMAERGHDYRDPADLRERIGRVSFEQERVTALAEASCVQRTGLADLGRQLEEELGAPIHDRYRNEIRDHRQMRVAALDRLEALGIAGDGVGAQP